MASLISLGALLLTGALVWLIVGPSLTEGSDLKDLRRGGRRG